MHIWCSAGADLFEVMRMLLTEFSEPIRVIFFTIVRANPIGNYRTKAIQVPIVSHKNQ